MGFFLMIFSSITIIISSWNLRHLLLRWSDYLWFSIGCMLAVGYSFLLCCRWSFCMNLSERRLIVFWWTIWGCPDDAEIYGELSFLDDQSLFFQLVKCDLHSLTIKSCENSLWMPLTLTSSSVFLEDASFPLKQAYCSLNMFLFRLKKYVKEVSPFV